MKLEFSEEQEKLIKELLELENIKFSKDNIEIYLTSLVKDRLLYIKGIQKAEEQQITILGADIYMRHYKIE